MPIVYDRHNTFTLHCSDEECDGEIEVHSITEGDTGQSYYTDASSDLISAGCPVCKKSLKEEY